MLMFVNNFYKLKNIFLNVSVMLYIIFSFTLYGFELINTEGIILLIVLFFLTYIFFYNIFENFSHDIDKHTKKMQQTILENIPKGIMITNNHGIIEYVNKQFEVITKFEKKEVIGHNASILKSGHHKSRFYEKLWNKIENEGYYVGEVINRKKNGEIYPQRVSITAIYDDSTINSYIAIFSDISEEKEILTRLKNENSTFKKKAHTDYLTNIYNRDKFDNILEYEYKKYHRFRDSFCLLFVDIDFFKKVNDNFGHDIGDEVLVAFSNILSKNIRQSDTVARWGGEEFIILFSNTNIDEGYTIALKLLKKIENYDFPKVGTLTASMGLVEYDEKYEIDELVKAADNALYKAKSSGRNRIEVTQ